MSLSFKLYITSPSESLQQIRRVSLPSTISWASLLETLVTLVQSPQFYVRYEDEEEDLVTINSQLEWTEALSILKKSSPIRLQITPASSLSLSSSTYNFLNALSSPSVNPEQQLSSPDDDLMKTVVIPDSEDIPEAEDKQHQFLAQSFELLGHVEESKENGNNLEQKVDTEPAGTQKEHENLTAPPKALNESYPLPVGFSPSFFENVNFVPEIFSGRFWLNDARLSNPNPLVKSVDIPQIPKSFEMGSEPQPSLENQQLIALPSLPTVETNQEQNKEATPAESQEPLVESQTLEVQQSVMIPQKWAKQVDDLLDMGFAFSDVIRVIQSVDGNLERALEALLN
eukprot:TRINITY_DN1537_c0_g1_i2.p1 TRINITY_DN1537_c0_g1~~TRINITY_DN1537_c0_g1_i2.p1  ORF type:complete len:360 (+),score=104.68 TRINITY_DN1537_c0_g1_i2:55-1080(+)